ncbi:anthocyanidin 3-O-glucoside 2'''-O-xylosyltransferase [Ranunculus cassubicifolius]
MAKSNSLHIVMYPYFAIGHMTPFLHLANKLAQRGQRISFILPPKAESKLSHFNLHPELITFIPITFPHVDGLPHGAQTTADVPIQSGSLIATAMDLTKPEVEEKLHQLKPHFVFFDIAYWIPELTRPLNIKSVHFCTMNAASAAYLFVPRRENEKQDSESELSLQQQPNGFPPSTIKLKKYEASLMKYIWKLEFGNGITFGERFEKSYSGCDAIAFKSCREMEGQFCDYVHRELGQHVLLTGPGLSDQPNDSLEDRWVKWLGKFNNQSVIYLSFGSECNLMLDQFHELLLGIELTGYPFLIALKTPLGYEKMEDALPEGFQERVGERGVVRDEWMQQQLLLAHPSIGCFVTHCGSGSLSEALVSECQIVLLPNIGDQYTNARLMGGDLKVGVEVEKRDEDGWYTKENVCEAVSSVMNEESMVGREIRANHAKWREFMLKEGLESSYIEEFVKTLHDILV